MLTFGRTSLMLIAVLTLVYVCLYFYLRDGARMRLEAEWDDAGRPGDRGPWVAERLEHKSRRMLRWLILPVYVLPLAGLAVIVALTN